MIAIRLWRPRNVPATATHRPSAGDAEGSGGPISWSRKHWGQVAAMARFRQTERRRQNSDT
ncbi:hypothetical protein C0J52_13239 [Blattella germanica]|nr:hypothetical protein C0J52_13239 [Blattella germanica]